MVLRLFIAGLLLLTASTGISADVGGWCPAWLRDAPYSPTFEVQDTEHKYGRYALQMKRVDVCDLIKFHGHFCGGLVEGGAALRVAFDQLFPDGVIDRTDLRIASNNSACGGDVAAYLTGARTRFGSHFIDKKLGASEFVVQQASTGRMIRVSINAETYPTEVRQQMRKIESGDYTPDDIDRFQVLQWDYAKRLVNRPLTESVDITKNPEYVWPEPPCEALGRRKDNDYKNIPLAR